VPNMPGDTAERGGYPAGNADLPAPPDAITVSRDDLTAVIRERGACSCPPGIADPKCPQHGAAVCQPNAALGSYDTQPCIRCHADHPPGTACPLAGARQRKTLEAAADLQDTLLGPGSAGLTAGPTGLLFHNANSVWCRGHDPVATPDICPDTADIAERFGPGGWRFTRDVAQVFDEHVRASVPFYDAIQNMIAEMADWLVPDGGLVADLGCSTGNTAQAIAARQKGREISFVLYDEAEAMTAKAVPAVAEHAGVRVTAHVRRLPDGPLNHDKADLTVIAFVLQFLPLTARSVLLAEARAAAAPGGALLVAEKLRVEDSRWAEIGVAVSHDYKAAAGISDTAIRAKERALRGVLRPVPSTTTELMIMDAGWSCPEVLFRWHSWALLGAFTSVS
jgi:tRNA (cmo5U34)-methyltransferase